MKIMKRGARTTAEYIKRDDVISGIKKHEESLYTYAELSVLDKIEDMVANIPTADVVEVVRCSECKYSLPIQSEIFVCCKRTWRNIEDDNYCAKGERRDVNE